MTQQTQDFILKLCTILSPIVLAYIAYRQARLNTKVDDLKAGQVERGEKQDAIAAKVMDIHDATVNSSTKENG